MYTNSLFVKVVVINVVFMYISFCKMVGFIALIFFLIHPLAAITRGPRVGWGKCGDPPVCDCSGPILHLIACTGIDTFPVFPPVLTAGVVHFDLHQSRLQHLEPFEREKWLSLKYLDVRNNDNITCDNVQMLRRNNLQVISDCGVDSLFEDAVTDVTVTHEPDIILPDEKFVVHVTTNNLWVVYGIFAVVVLGLIFYVDSKRKRANFGVGNKRKRAKDPVSVPLSTIEKQSC